MVENDMELNLTRYFDGAVRAFALALYTLMILVIGLQILTRWILGSLIGNSLPWTVNFSQMLLVYVTFIGAAVASGKRAHLSLDLLVSRLPDRSIRVLTALRTILVLVFVVVMVRGAYPLYQANKGYPIGAMPTYPPFTEAWLYVPVIVGGVVIAIYALRDLYEVVRSPETILDDVTRGDDNDGN